MNLWASSGTLVCMRARESPVGQQVDEQAQEAEVLANLRRRSTDALARLVQAYGDRLTRAAWLYLGDAHAAQDAAQETLIAAWDGAGRTTEQTVLRSWLFGILINRCRKHVRSAIRRRQREKAAMALRPEMTVVAEDDQRLEKLQKSLERLCPEHRELIILRFYENMSVLQTAMTLEIPEGTVKSRCHAAIADLRRLMENDDES